VALEEKGKKDKEIVYELNEHKRVEEALRESEEQYRSIVNLSGELGEAIAMLQDTNQGEGIQTFVNDGWPHITGYSREELIGTSFFNLVHPEDRKASQKRHQSKMKGKVVPGLFEMTIIRKDGTEVPIELTSAYTTYKGGHANVAHIRDITERKRAEEREKQLQQELNLAGRLATIGTMSSGIAHEINNPLTGVIGFSSLLLKKDLPDDIREVVNIIYEGAQRVASITERMLTFARQHKPERNSVDINEIIENTLAMRAYEMERSNIKVTTELSTDIPLTFADAGQLQQVFLNIILNAEMEMVLAHGRGNLTIKTERIDNIIRISFRDDGLGIPKNNMDRIFDPFFTTRDPDKGTGLGLSICYSIVTQHGGKIYARCRLRKGATFFVELPIVTKEEWKNG
jgi:PAS domain S-box-containing protein